LKRVFRPEFLNRIDKVLVFRPLTREDLREIVDIQTSRFAPRLEEQGLTLDITQAAKDLLAQDGYDPDYGARPLRRAIMNLLEDPLSEGLLSGRFHPGDVIMADAVDDEIVFEVTERHAEEAPEPMPA